MSKMIEKCTMPHDLSRKMRLDARVLGEPEIKADGSMTFQFYLDSQLIIQKYVT